MLFVNPTFTLKSPASNKTVNVVRKKERKDANNELKAQPFEGVQER